MSGVRSPAPRDLRVNTTLLPRLAGLEHLCMTASVVDGTVISINLLVYQKSAKVGYCDETKHLQSKSCRKSRSNAREWLDSCQTSANVQLVVLEKSERYFLGFF